MWVFPLAFLSSEEVLSIGLSKLVNDKRILHMANPKGYITPSHILYTNVIFVFCRVSNKSLQNLSIYLQKYGDFSS